ncbi:serine/threonine protein kinase [Nostoc sp. CMAA1605]|uniref:serine/threonine protein kinase n=1 Tax=Nostoc sp. CMAA1605 TaxID=2055159 RepID=UPI001F42BE4B|nr:serine/threonine-protein kinase [Nostoc sp. CMAA1605]MCF4966530.1 serine/threonine protein kinase [Nostoc sp. CMAA1605]
MTIYPDFDQHGYQILQELGRNREGGRITWLASDVKTTQQVVLKQFCFAQFGSSWSGFEAHQREIQILQGLAHPGIPKYMGSFATSDGFCLVQEYINAPSLAEARKFTPAEIKQIAINALKILVYLQNLQPPVIHRDIKPENILVDEALNVYLIDFGFARIDSGEVAGSSVFKGTPGFIPPEQMFKPTKATDLYALGTTLICLLTQIKSPEIRELCDRNNPYLIKFSHLLPKLSLRFLSWLENMVQPEQDKRFANAQAALAALQALDVMRVPGVDFSETVLKFKANRLGEKLTQSFTVENTIPETLLQGRWEVAPHPHDPPHTPDSHAWILVTPAEFKGNHTRCQVQVDTSKLMADKQYKRQLILHSNAYPENHTLTVKVQTATLPIEKLAIPYAWLVGVLLICIIASASMTWFITVVGLSAVKEAIIAAMFGAVIGGLVGMTIGAIIDCILYFLDFQGIPRTLIITAIGTVLGLPLGSVQALLSSYNSIGIGIGIGIKIGIGIGIGIWILFIFWAVLWASIVGKDRHYDHTNPRYLYNKWIDILLSFLTAILGTSFGIICIINFFNPYILLALAGTGLPLISMLLYPAFKRRRLIAQYRQSEKSLIEP